MAELKVDKILPATGSSISLSESGKTVLIPSGATLDASAATLSGIGARVDYCTSVQSSPFTAAAGKGYFINTGSAVTVTLPSSPSAGDEIIVIDSTGQAATNNITLGRNTNKIKGLCACATLKTDRVGVRIIYSGSSQGWVTVTSANETPPVLDQTLYVTATGGTVTTCGDFKIHIFTSSSDFVVSCGGNSNGSNTVDYLVVGGGGAGGNSNTSVSGGGGAGGYRTTYPSPATGGLPVSVQTYAITVGAGGTGAIATPGSANPGNDSTFSTITSSGGGGGGNFGPLTAASGGSGGGGYSTNGASPGVGGAGNTPPVSPPQGNPGGNGYDGGPVSNLGAGGGGGAGAAGGSASAPGTSSGSGGVGKAAAIFGSIPTAPSYGTPGPAPGRYFTGGGGGAHYNGTAGSGGAGGGGAGATNPSVGTAGTANTGGGGGGSCGPGLTGANGGSGVVIIRYKFQN